MAEQYLALPAGRAVDLKPALDALCSEALSPSLSASLRQKLITKLLDDLSKQAWDEPVVCAALLALKLLGRSPAGSEQLASERALTVLAKRGGLLTAAAKPPATLADSSLEALRCLCNVLLLVEPARDAFEGLTNALTGVMALLTVPAAQPAHFLAGRILFLLTVKGGDVVRILIEEHGFMADGVQALEDALQHLQKSLSTTHPEQMLAPLAEQLKLLFNLAVYYPRLIAIDGKSPTASPRLESADSSPTLSPDLRSPSATMKRKGSSIKEFFTRTKPGSRPGSPSPSSPRPDQGPLEGRGFDAIVEHLVGLAVGLPMSTSDYLPKPPLNHALHALVEFPMSNVWLSEPPVHTQPLRAPLPNSSANGVEQHSLPPLVARLLGLLDVATTHWCSGDPDSASNAERLRNEGEADVDASIAALLLLLRKVVVGDTTGMTAALLRARLLADDIDRSKPLERRDDLTGRLIRLMGAVYLQNSKVGAGELLFALCGQDPALLSRTIGWGNAAGFLTSNKLAAGPPTDNSLPADNRIDPITGTFFDDSEPAGAHMSDAEKEAEAERLMVLFDRLGKTGVVNVQNPMQEAQQNGRFEELSLDDQVQDDEKEEQEALADFARYKERKLKNAAGV